MGFIQSVKNERTLESLISKAKREYLKRYETEKKLKDSLKEMLMDQIRRIDLMFDNYSQQLEEYFPFA
jgi:hypothetical protein